MNGRVNLIVRHSNSFGRNQLKIFCDSLVFSVLNYLFPVWGTVCKPLINSIM